MKSTFGVIFRTVNKKVLDQAFRSHLFKFSFPANTCFSFLRIFQITFLSFLIKLCEFTIDILESITFVAMSFLPNI